MLTANDTHKHDFTTGLSIHSYSVPADCSSVCKPLHSACLHGCACRLIHVSQLRGVRGGGGGGGYIEKLLASTKTSIQQQQCPLCSKLVSYMSPSGQ